MALPASLSSLSTREAIQDAFIRCVTGLDMDNLELFKSAFTEDASFDLNGNVMSGFDAIVTGCYNTISKLDTTHYLTNIRIDVADGASTAAATCSALAQHYRAGEGSKDGTTRYLTGCLYNIDVVRDDQAGLWKVKHWKLKIVWTEGDMGVLTGN